MDGDTLDVSWPLLEIALKEIFIPAKSSETTKLQFGQIRWSQPKVRFTRSKVTETQDTSTRSAEQQESSAEGSDLSPQLEIEGFDIKQGELTLVDQNTQPFYRSGYRNLRLKAKQLRWPQLDLASFSLSADGTNGSKLRGSSTLKQGLGSIALKMEQFPLPSVNPYATSLAGYRIDSGSFQIESNAKLGSKRYRVDNDIQLTDLAIGKHKAGSFEEFVGVPLNVALVLLKDPFGNIDLPVHVAWDRGTKVKMLPLVIAGFRQALIGALSSPLKALGALAQFGKAEGPPARVEMLPGSSQVAKPEMVQEMADFIASHPRFSLRLYGQSGDNDQAELARHFLSQQLANGTKVRFPDGLGLGARSRLRAALGYSQEEREANLSAEEKQQYQEWVAGVEIPQEKWDELASQRATALQSYFNKEFGIAMNNLLVGDNRPGEAGVGLELVVP